MNREQGSEHTPGWLVFLQRSAILGVVASLVVAAGEHRTSSGNAEKQIAPAAKNIGTDAPRPRYTSMTELTTGDALTERTPWGPLPSLNELTTGDALRVERTEEDIIARGQYHD